MTVKRKTKRLKTGTELSRAADLIAEGGLASITLPSGRTITATGEQIRQRSPEYTKQLKYALPAQQPEEFEPSQTARPSFSQAYRITRTLTHGEPMPYMWTAGGTVKPKKKEEAEQTQQVQRKPLWQRRIDYRFQLYWNARKAEQQGKVQEAVRNYTAWAKGLDLNAHFYGLEDDPAAQKALKMAQQIRKQIIANPNSGQVIFLARQLETLIKDWDKIAQQRREERQRQQELERQQKTAERKRRETYLTNWYRYTRDRYNALEKQVRDLQARIASYGENPKSATERREKAYYQNLLDRITAPGGPLEQARKDFEQAQREYRAFYYGEPEQPLVEPLPGENVVRRPEPEVELPEEQLAISAPENPEERVIGQVYLLPDGRKGEWTGTGWRIVYTQW